MASIAKASITTCLNDPLLTEAVGYLSFPESVASVSKHMRKIADEAIIYSTRTSSFLRQIDRTLELPSDEKIRARKVREIGVQLIQVYSCLLTESEWREAGYNPQSYRGPWNFDRMQFLIRNQRSQNLIHFFNRVVAPEVPHANDFSVSLSKKTFSPHEKAVEIRKWMGMNRRLFAGIHEIDLRDLPMVPAEVLLCSNLALDQLGRIFMEAYDAGNSELFDRILKSPRFPRIPDMALAYVYGNALQRNDLPFLTALICSPKAGPITHYIGETLATTNDPWLRETILESKIFPQIPADYIGNAAVVAASRGNTKTYLRLAKSNQFAGISIEQIGNILVNATFVNTLEIANHIMKDLRIDFIPVNDLEEALNNGLRFENRPMIHLLLTHSSIREIENELLEEAGKFISKIKI